MQDKSIEFAKNYYDALMKQAHKYSYSVVVDACDIKTALVISWANTFSTMIPDAIIQNDTISSYVYLDAAIMSIKNTKILPTNNMLSRVASIIDDHDAHMNTDRIDKFIITWIETFSILPPDDIMTRCYRNKDVNLNYINICTKFIQTTKSKPSAELYWHVTHDSHKHVDSELKFMITWIETFSELPPDDVFSSLKCNEYGKIGEVFIRTTNQKPGQKLLDSIKSLGTLLSPNFLVTWIETFSELPPDDIITNNLLYGCDICDAFIRKTHTKDQHLVELVDKSATKCNQSQSTKLYNSWIEIFSEIPPDSILKHATRNLILEENIMLKQKLLSIKNIVGE